MDMDYHLVFRKSRRCRIISLTRVLKGATKKISGADGNKGNAWQLSIVA